MTAFWPHGLGDSRADKIGTDRPGHVRLFLIRHGATTGSARHVLAGRTDVDLSSVGRRQARELAAYLATWPLSAIYSSPQKRAHKTALAVAADRPATPLILCEDLRELDLGMVEGLTAWEASRRWPHLVETALDQATRDFAFPEGESWSAAERRARRALSMIVRAHQAGETVAVVTHGAILGFVLARYSNEGRGAWRRYQPRHGTVSSVAAGTREGDLWLLPIAIDVSDFWTRRLRTAVLLRKTRPPSPETDHASRAYNIRSRGLRTRRSG
ncbi:MAG: histidine phosphatase family protein [Clostridia bacterium]